MGGYGATRIGMKHSDMFGSLYIMSPCCLSPRPAVSPEIAKSLKRPKHLRLPQACRFLSVPR